MTTTFAQLGLPDALVHALAKRDIVVKRKVTSQGIEVEREITVAKAGEPASFLFYNSQGYCMVDTDVGPAWTPCTFDDTFEGLSPEAPNACEQHWWIQVRYQRPWKFHRTVLISIVLKALLSIPRCLPTWPRIILITTSPWMPTLTPRQNCLQCRG